jgi:N-acetylglucosamine kinase-like BadF-type ATPase
MTLYLGVDGGGTKTEFVVLDESGAVVARALTGTTYHLEIGFEEAVRRIEQGVGGVCRALGIAPDAFASAFFGLPAYGEDRDIDPRLHAACGRILGHDRFRVGNDMVCGWAGSLACADGINIVAGTGSIGYGERRGTAARVGGWSELFGDEGSGFWIAREGLAAFTRQSDGRLPRGALHQHFRTTLALADDLDVCARVMGPPAMTRGEIAAFAPLVVAAAGEGDSAAAAILDRAAAELADLALALRRTLGFAPDEPAALSWSGSILTEVAPVRERFVALLGDDAFRFVEPRHPPGYGAALYARHIAL